MTATGEEHKQDFFRRGISGSLFAAPHVKISMVHRDCRDGIGWTLPLRQHTKRSSLIRRYATTNETSSAQAGDLKESNE